VTALDIVVVTSGADAFNQEGPDALDGGKDANRHDEGQVVVVVVVLEV